ncbi:MAG: hypothetical protein ACK5A1_09395, partial [Planctomyces sp.]
MFNANDAAKLFDAWRQQQTLCPPCPLWSKKTPHTAAACGGATFCRRYFPAVFPLAFFTAFLAAFFTAFLADAELAAGREAVFFFGAFGVALPAGGLPLT